MEVFRGRFAGTPQERPPEQRETPMTNPADNSADYEDLTGALRERVSSLHADELVHLIDEERRHDNRTPVIEVLESRLAQLRGDTPAD